MCVLSSFIVFVAVPLLYSHPRVASLQWPLVLLAAGADGAAGRFLHLGFRDVFSFVGHSTTVCVLDQRNVLLTSGKSAPTAAAAQMVAEGPSAREAGRRTSLSHKDNPKKRRASKQAGAQASEVSKVLVAVRVRPLTKAEAEETAGEADARVRASEGRRVDVADYFFSNKFLVRALIGRELGGRGCEWGHSSSREPGGLGPVAARARGSRLCGCHFGSLSFRKEFSFFLFSLGLL